MQPHYEVYRTFRTKSLSFSLLLLSPPNRINSPPNLSRSSLSPLKALSPSSVSSRRRRRCRILSPPQILPSSLSCSRLPQIESTLPRSFSDLSPQKTLAALVCELSPSTTLQDLVVISNPPLAFLSPRHLKSALNLRTTHPFQPHFSTTNIFLALNSCNLDLKP